jgi:hypothetical protein
MTVLVMRGVVQYGRFDEFRAAARKYNDGRKALGLPPYRLLARASGGLVNEVFFVAEFGSEAEIEAADERLMADDVTRVPLRALYDTLVPATVVEHRFTEFDL